MRHEMINRITACFCAALLLLCAVPAFCDDLTPQYIAEVRVDCSLRTEPRENAPVELRLKEGNEVKVMEYAPEWCYVTRKGDKGYVKTDYLRYFRSQDAFLYPVPGYTFQMGLGTAREEMFVSSDNFDGVTVKTGSVFAVQRPVPGGYELAVARGTCFAEAEKVDYVPFPDWQDAKAGDVICAFTTYYNDHYSKYRNEERQHNIALGCERISGTVLDPGESFSFNELCAPYTEKNGYQYAANISKSGYGYGGGVCQVSTTLYNALLGLPLKITKWNVHWDKGVPYIPVQFDSAVGSYTDLCFENTLPYRIRLEAFPQDGTIMVLIYAEPGA